MRRSNRRGSGDTGKIVGGIVLFLLGALALGYAGYFWLNTDRIAPPDPNGCPTNGPGAITVVLVDTSDELPEPSKRELATYISDLAEDIPTGGLLELRLLDPRSDGGKIIFSNCNPGDGRALNNLTGNPELAKKRWRDMFQNPLQKSIEVALQPIPAQTSPILTTLQRIALDRFTSRAAASVPKTLVIVSDLIEHTPDYSQYHGDLTYERFRKSLAYRKVKTDLHRTSVRIYYVQRKMPTAFDTGAHIRFWLDWVEDNNGRFLDAKKLQGVR